MSSGATESKLDRTFQIKYGAHMARVREFDTEAAVEAAMSAFRRTGYEGTSVQDLVDATGLGGGRCMRRSKARKACTWRRWTATGSSTRSR